MAQNKTVKVDLKRPWTMQSSVTRQPVENIRGLLLEAYEHGEAFGVYTGRDADRIKKAFKSLHPILIDVNVVAEVDERCKRLNIKNGQRQVFELGMKHAIDRVSEYQLDFCRDGSLKWEK